ncbi:MAG: tRNA (adenosine(37)-N6)-threonylcarbamoyltransferase complex dimerization subunit type 1 TsaB [Clostridia bacterium]|nr:tRNA (adenosine(37)-N6)-threonylcarbamoyltransferase complex dimerization subunit type 1 TsaB [Clostridia bacterium]
MRIFSVDCSAGPASVAIVEFFDDGTNEVLAYSFKNEGLTHSQTLVPMMDEVLKTANLELSDIDFYAINAGPGSFTGVRIGVAALKGITALSDANCIPVSTLHSMAYNYIDKNVTVCATMDARCNQAYTATFDIFDGKITRIFDDEALLIDELNEKLKSLKKDIIFVGDGASLCYNTLIKRISCSLSEEDRRYQNAVSVALCAKDMMDNGFKPISSADLLPTYLRAPQAERELKRRGKI